MKKISARIILLLIVAATAFNANAQKKCSKPDYGQGEDSVKCLENLSIYNVYFKQNNYNDALLGWRKVFNDCPCASKNIFLHGEKIYKTLLENENDAKRKEELLDTLLLIYDKRLEHYGQKAYVTGKKGSDLLKYKPTEFEEAFTLLKSSIETAGNASSASFITGYYQAAVFKFKKETLSQIEAIELYNKLVEICESNIAKNDKDKANYETAKEILNKLFIDDVKPDCPTMVSILKPKFDANPKDIDLLKKITSTLSDCKDQQLYKDAAVALAELEPSAEAFSNLARMFFYFKEMESAKTFYLKAIELETDNTKKAELYYELSAVVSKNASLSVSYAQKAIALNPKHGKAYLMIAQQYAGGASTCAEGSKNPAFFKQTVYWAAVDYCNKAKTVDSSVESEANSLISRYKPQFPKTEDIFFEGLKEGDSFTIDCWFSATTTVRANN